MTTVIEISRICNVERVSGEFDTHRDRLKAIETKKKATHNILSKLQ